jgi:hypothetical protein
VFLAVKLYTDKNSIKSSASSSWQPETKHYLKSNDNRAVSNLTAVI